MPHFRAISSAVNRSALSAAKMPSADPAMIVRASSIAMCVSINGVGSMLAACSSFSIGLDGIVPMRMGGILSGRLSVSSKFKRRRAGRGRRENPSAGTARAV